MIRCIVSDLDGTLVKTSMNVIDPKTIALLKQYQSMGILVILASGRPLTMMEDVGESLDLHKHGGYLVGHNGYQVYHYKKQVLEHKEVYLNQDVIDATFSFAQKHLSYLSLYGMDTTYSYGHRLVRFVKRLYFLIRLRKSAHGFLRVYEDINSLDAVVEPIFKLGVASYSPKTLITLQDTVNQRFGDDVEVVRVNERYIDITPKGINKGTALQEILALEGIDPSEVIAFGDAENDISMINIAGLGVAMENAMDNVKEASDMVCASNMNDGVYHTLREVLKHLDTDIV